MNNLTNFADQLTNALELTLDFVQTENVTNDIDLLVVIQTFVQQITLNLKQNLDPSMIH